MVVFEAVLWNQMTNHQWVKGNVSNVDGNGHPAHHVNTPCMHVDQQRIAYGWTDTEVGRPGRQWADDDDGGLGCDRCGEDILGARRRPRHAPSGLVGYGQHLSLCCQLVCAGGSLSCMHGGLAVAAGVALAHGRGRSVGVMLQWISNRACMHAASRPNGAEHGHQEGCSGLTFLRGQQQTAKRSIHPGNPLGNSSAV
jgi:hypothetical protein